MVLISSIGSLPEKISGLPYEYSKLKMKNDNGYRVDGFSNVFAIGNAVTGKGNIRESKKHGSLMTKKIIEEHLGQEDLLEEWLVNYNKNIKTKVQEQIKEIESEINSKSIMPDDVIQNILNKTKSLQNRVAYSTYENWIKLKTPVRLEDMSNK